MDAVGLGKRAGELVSGFDQVAAALAGPVLQRVGRHGEFESLLDDLANFRTVAFILLEYCRVMNPCRGGLFGRQVHFGRLAWSA